MINNDSILLQLTTDEIIALESLVKLAKEAKEVAKLIKGKYRFGIGEEKIVIWNDGYNEENFTIDGVWNAEYLNEKYSVECTEEGIYDVFRAQFLYDNNYSKDLQLKEKSKAAVHFREFVKHTRLMK